MAKDRDITPDSVYFDRRNFLKQAGIALGSASLASLACCGSLVSAATQEKISAKPCTDEEARACHDEFDQRVSPMRVVRSFGNYYEFTRSNRGIADLAAQLPLKPWEIEVAGLVRKAGVYDIDDLKRFGPQQRIYRHRCNEAWSMVIPWDGIPLRGLLQAAEPLSQAKWVRFVARLDPKHMPGQDPEHFKEWFATVNKRVETGFGTMGLLSEHPYKWPYAEALRIDEAMHPLVMLATGMYDRPLPPENGAPVRLVVPWKYAFKSLKAVVRIELVAQKPETFWHYTSPKEFGFWGNVNPDIPHPRWPQGREYRFVGAKSEPILPTLLFNGYAEEAYPLYKGMNIDAMY